MPYIQSILSSKNQVVIPSEVRKALNITSGDKIVWSVARISDRPKAIAEPVSKNWSKAAKGLGKNLWKKVSIENYIKDLRNEWERIDSI